MDLEAGAPRRAIWAFTALLGSTIAGCHSSAPDDGLALVDYWPAQHLIFVGAKRSAHIDVLRAPSNRTQHGLEFVERLQYPGQKPIVRLVFDRHRVRLWIAAGSEVYIYQYSEDVFTSPQLTKVAVANE